MQALLKDIQDGSFADRLIADHEAGSPEMARLRAADHDHQIEQVGARLACPDAVPRPDRGRGRPGPGVGHDAGRGPVSATSARVPRPAGPFVAAGSVRIFDTTLRDGEQAPGAGLTAAEKLDVARQLARLKVDVIEAGFPAASPGDFEAVRRIAQETRGGIAVAALARCKDGDPQRAIEAIRVAERPHLHVFIATSDIHLKHKLRIDRETALAEAVRWVRYGREQLGRDAEIEFSAEDASRTDDGVPRSRSTRRWSRPARRRSTSRTPSATPSRPSSARWSGASSALVGDAGHGQRPLPQRPGAGHGQHPRRGPGRGAPGRGHDQRPRRAGRQRLARGGRHGAPDAPDAVPRARSRASPPSS